MCAVHSTKHLDVLDNMSWIVPTGSWPASPCKRSDSTFAEDFVSAIVRVISSYASDMAFTALSVEPHRKDEIPWDPLDPLALLVKESSGSDAPRMMSKICYCFLSNL